MDNSIEYSKHLGIIREDMSKPSVLYQQSLKISIDGDMYCVLMGENLQEGIAGFGKTLQEAMDKFDNNFYKPLKKEDCKLNPDDLECSLF